MIDKFLIILALICMIGCSNDDDNNDGFRRNELDLDTSIIFGEIYGLCAGDCRTLYLLTEDAIYEDANIESDFGNFQNTLFKNESLSSDKFDLSKELLEFPDGLLTSNNNISEQTIADFDYFVQLTVDNEIRTWVFDKIHQDTDEEIKAYFENLIQINNQLKD